MTILLPNNNNSNKLLISTAAPAYDSIISLLPLNGYSYDLVSGKMILVSSGGGIHTDQMGLSLKGNGSSACASIPINLSNYTKVAVSFLLYWDAHANNDALALEFTANANFNQGFMIDPNEAGGFFGIGVSCGGGSGIALGTFSRTIAPAAAWHHIAINMVHSTPSTVATAIPNAWVNGVPVTLNSSAYTGTGAATAFANSTLYLFSRNNASLFGAGRIMNLVIRGGYTLTQDDVNQEYRYPNCLYFGSSPIPIPTLAPTGNKLISIPAGYTPKTDGSVSAFNHDIPLRPSVLLYKNKSQFNDFQPNQADSVIGPPLFLFQAQSLRENRGYWGTPTLNNISLKPYGDNIGLKANGSGSGVTWGVKKVLSGKSCTMLSIFNMAASDVITSGLFQQRTSSSPYDQVSLLANVGDNGAIVSGKIGAFFRETSFDYKQSAISVSDGLHVVAVSLHPDGTVYWSLDGGKPSTITNTNSGVLNNFGIGTSQELSVGSFGGTSDLGVILSAAWQGPSTQEALNALTADPWQVLRSNNKTIPFPQPRPFIKTTSKTKNESNTNKWTIFGALDSLTQTNKVGVKALNYSATNGSSNGFTKRINPFGPCNSYNWNAGVTSSAPFTQGVSGIFCGSLYSTQTSFLSVQYYPEDTGGSYRQITASYNGSGIYLSNITDIAVNTGTANVDDPNMTMFAFRYIISSKELTLYYKNRIYRATGSLEMPQAIGSVYANSSTDGSSLNAVNYVAITSEIMTDAALQLLIENPNNLLKEISKQVPSSSVTTDNGIIVPPYLSSPQAINLTSTTATPRVKVDY